MTGELLYWIREISKEGYVYSVDKIRMNLWFGKYIDNVNKYIKHLDAWDQSYDILYHRSYKPYTYAHMFTIKIYGGSFAIAYGWQGKKSEYQKGWIEFNPNKVADCKSFVDFWQKIKQYTVTAEIVRFDFAVDIPVSRQYVHMQRKGNMRYQVTIQDGKTESNGIHNNVGFTKVYDKKKESKLPYECTRVEITLDLKTNPWDALPDVYLTDDQIAFIMDDNLNQNDKVFIQLLKESPSRELHLQEMTYRKRQKFLPYIYSSKLEVEKITYLELKRKLREFERTLKL